MQALKTHLVRLGDYLRIHPLLAAWLLAAPSPFVLMFLVQIPLCHIRLISDFFESLPPVATFWALTLFCILPAYLILAFMIPRRIPRLLSLGGFTFLLTGAIPLLWVFGFYTSRLAFSDCV
ncbi:MAG: hypothetical protein JWM96_1227 [Alphaproteobacteria bacterium]|nr:hypothetical protein [Alphaproteobacteria bacterium]